MLQFNDINKCLDVLIFFFFSKNVKKNTKRKDMDDNEYLYGASDVFDRFRLYVLQKNAQNTVPWRR